MIRFCILRLSFLFSFRRVRHFRIFLEILLHIHIQICLRAEAFNDGAVVDLHGFGLDISHDHGSGIHHDRALDINISLYRSGDHRGRTVDISDDHGTYTDPHLTFCMYFTFDLCLIGIDLAGGYISVNCSAKDQLTLAVYLTGNGTDEIDISFGFQITPDLRFCRDIGAVCSKSAHRLI